MANVIIFPGVKKLEAGAPDVAVTAPAEPMAEAKHQGDFLMYKLFSGVIKAVWLVTVLFWPILKWIVSIDAFFKLVVMLYHWYTPWRHDGWVFLLHFGVLTALTYFVAIYKPKGL